MLVTMMLHQYDICNAYLSHLVDLLLFEAPSIDLRV